MTAEEAIIAAAVVIVIIICGSLGAAKFETAQRITFAEKDAKKVSTYPWWY